MFSIEELLILTFGLLLRAMTSVHPHSGQGQPPMFGDYEAQRHWQEITVNLPIEEWYFNSTDNDLLYWGLDYPPLTAYHSWIIGQVAQLVDPSYVELHKSRGREDYYHKILMRNSVLVVDACLLLPAFWAFARSISKAKLITLSALAFYPGLILIDNGHFQYNGVSLGLFFTAVVFILNRMDLMATMAFVMALSYKQMELYHSLPFFSYLLGLCLRREPSWAKGLFKLASISLVVFATFAVAWWPFWTDLNMLKQVLTRIFPLNRGLFEDKVANFWCSFNVAFKLKGHYDPSTLAVMSAMTTLISVLPCNVALFLRPSKDSFLSALLSTSLAFFLFSYQVHEKSILLVALPALMNLKNFKGHRYSDFALTWFALVSTFSMWPLLQKDGLGVAFVALQAIFLCTCHYAALLEFNHDNLSEEAAKKKSSPKPLSQTDMSKANLQDWLIWTLFNFSLVGFTILILGSVHVEPPNGYPHIWPLLVSAFSAGHFVAFLAFFNFCHFKQFLALGPTNEAKKNN